MLVMKSSLRISFLILVIFAALSAHAANDVLLIVRSNGGTVNDSTYIELDTNPVISFTKESLTVSTSDLVISYDKVVNISFTDKVPVDIPTSISPVNANKVLLRFTSPATFDLLNVPDGARISVYTVDGRLYPSEIAVSGDVATVSLAGSNNGVYIIKVGNKSFKVTKR